MKINSPDIQEFRKSPPLTAAVGIALQDPAVQRAIEFIKRTTIPTGLPAPVEGVPYDTTVSHCYHFMMGVNAAMEAFKNMAVPAAEKKAPAEEDEEFAVYGDQKPPTITQ